MSASEKMSCSVCSSCAIFPSGSFTVYSRDRMSFPPLRCGRVALNMVCMMDGMPASANTFSMQKPGAALIAFSINVAPTGISVIFNRASFNSCSLSA